MKTKDKRWGPWGYDPRVVAGTTDVKITNEGTVFAFELLTTTASDWVNEHVAEPLFFGHTLVVEHRFAWNLFQALVIDGLEVK